MTKRTKYNVSADKKDRVYNGIKFDSALEMRYYRDVLLPKVESGEVTYYERQKKYILQDGFVYRGKKILPITYVADFYIEYADGRKEVIDIKGLADAKSLIKRKMFWYRYPETDYHWLAYLKKYGGWGSYDEYRRLQNSEKKAAKLAAEEEKEKQNGKKSN